jgi:endonuclease YncB( thermonuclease family)
LQTRTCWFDSNPRLHSSTHVGQALWYGDTITLLDAEHGQRKVWMNGIDVPEKGRGFGNASRRSLINPRRR